MVGWHCAGVWDIHGRRQDTLRVSIWYLIDSAGISSVAPRIYICVSPRSAAYGCLLFYETL